MRRRSLVLVAVLAMAVAGCGQVSDSAGLSSTIAVHGDWTIDVHNPDGTLDRHIEFSNHLTDEGAEALARLASGKHLAQNYWIEVASVTGVPPCPSRPEDNVCVAGEAYLPATSSGGTTIIAASQVATRDGQIGTVATRIFMFECESISECRAATSVNEYVPILTSTDIVDPATGGEYVIAEGQTFDITVEISFVSG